MPYLETIRRAFVSYSRQDQTFVATLASDLRKSAFELWVDFEGLEPGTPDWERAVREAIEESFAFLLIASPDSRRSSYVRSELLLAQAKEIPIYAIWAAGESWIDSVPMNLAHMQYLDFRGDAYADSLRVLIGELSGFDAAIPKHFIYRSFFEKAWWEFGGSKVLRKEPVRGAMMITLSQQDSLDALFVRPNAFKTAAHLLDEIYINYLAYRYPPFSYGREWHLRRSLGRPTQIAVDWRLLHGQLESKRSLITLMNGSPETYGLVVDSYWNIAHGMPSETTVLAAYDRWLIETMLQNNKAAHYLMGYMEVVDAAKFIQTKREFIAVVTDFYIYGCPKAFVNKLFIQTEDCPAEVKERWTY